MRNYIRIIDRLLERFRLRQISIDDSVACYFLVNLRQFMEVEQITAQFPTIYLYACWCLHPELDRNRVSQQVLLSIIAGLPSANVVDPTFIDIVCENLGAEKLRQEIGSIGTLYGFRDIVSDAQLWRDLYGTILNLVTEKPLAPPLTIPAASRLRIAAGVAPFVQTPSTIRLWLHGDRGQQAEWTVAIVPDGHNFDMNNISSFQTFSGGVFSIN